MAQSKNGKTQNLSSGQYLRNLHIRLVSLRAVIQQRTQIYTTVAAAALVTLSVVVLIDKQLIIK